MLLFGVTLAVWTLCAAGAVERGQGVNGEALDASSGAVVVPADPVFRRLPLTVECRVRLSAPDGYHILVANELKSSATHWEIFTTPGAASCAPTSRVAPRTTLTPRSP